jgi:hypothetical protein
MYLFLTFSTRHPHLPLHAEAGLAMEHFSKIAVQVQRYRRPSRACLGHRRYHHFIAAVLIPVSFTTTPRRPDSKHVVDESFSTLMNLPMFVRLSMYQNIPMKKGRRFGTITTICVRSRETVVKQLAGSKNDG